MTPLVIHRYTFSIDEAVRALLADHAGDCAGWSMRLEHGSVVIDVVEPGTSLLPPPAPAVEPAAPKVEAEPDKPKGGPLARRCAMLCQEQGFATFLGLRTADEVVADIQRRCDIDSRAMLDHDEAAAAVWRDIEGKYQLWLAGHDVEV